MKTKAIVVFSGGQDSTTCLIQALGQYDEVHCITFDYGQRHKKEIEVAQAIAKTLQVTSHKIMDVSLLNELAISSLTREQILVAMNLKTTDCQILSFRSKYFISDPCWHLCLPIKSANSDHRRL